MPASNTPKKHRKSVRKRKKKVRISASTAIAIAAAIVLCIGIKLILNKKKPATETGAPVPQMSFSACGIDISHNNTGPIIWDSLLVMVDRSGRTVKSLDAAQKVYPVKFVFMKATEGSSNKDPMFKEYWQKAAEHGIQRGAYHFFRSSKDGEIQARNFIAAVGGLKHSDLPPVLDIETIHMGCSTKTLNARALQWLRVIEKHYGRKPVVYTYESFAKDFLSREITDNYPIWIAHYGVESPDLQDWEYWQCTDKALVYGLPEPVDLDVRR